VSYLLCFGERPELTDDGTFYDDGSEAAFSDLVRLAGEHKDYSETVDRDESSVVSMWTTDVRSHIVVDVKKSRNFAWSPFLGSRRSARNLGKWFMTVLVARCGFIR